MRNLMILLVLTGCGAPPCQYAVAGGERYCAMLCAPNDERAGHLCPSELPARTELDGAALCRGSEGEPTDAICDQLPGHCGRPAPPPPEPWRAELEALTSPLVRDCAPGHMDVVWPGPLPDEASAETSAALMRIPGVQSAGFGACCTGDEGLCARVSYLRHATDPAQLITAIEALLAPDASRGLAVRLEARGRSGPRCEADNPLCLPDAYEGCHVYRADGPRRSSALGRGGGSCEHDGECVIAGCGNECVNWTMTGPGTCEGYTPARPTFCGCLEGSCAWFTQ